MSNAALLGKQDWVRKLERQFTIRSREGKLTPTRQFHLLQQGIQILAQARLGRNGWSAKSAQFALSEQPFDAHLLALSPLYRQSRKRYLEGGGAFRAALVSSPRTLSSSILLSQVIEFSPIGSEMIWAATDPAQRRSQEHLLHLRTFSSSLFHEQSHRILWRILPPPAAGAAGFRRYLNFVESLVIALDMALGDELGPSLARVFYLSGVTYDPGTRVREGLSRREYRNYLQAALHATYLNLEHFEPAEIPQAVSALFPMIPPALQARVCGRSLNLDRGFVTRTNPQWQMRHRAQAARELGRLAGERWSPPTDPLDHREQYLFAERWFDLFGL